MWVIEADMYDSIHLNNNSFVYVICNLNFTLKQNMKIKNKIENKKCKLHNN